MASLATRLVDKFIGFASPDAGLRRLRARDMLTRAYEGASTKDGWHPKRAGASANTDHLADGTTLRIRARSLVQNISYVSRAIDSLVANTVGCGIVPRSLSKKNALEIDNLWAQFEKTADADGRVSLQKLVAIAYGVMEVDGEVLVRKRPRRLADKLPVPLQLQVLEIDWLDSTKMGNNGGNAIMNGIEYDVLGKIVAYWLWSQHPGELLPGNRAKAASSPVPASQIIHLFAQRRPGQGRGFTRLAPVISRVRDLHLYEDAELQRKNLETRLSVLASGDVASMSLTESDAQATVQNTGELGMLSSGGITQVPSGVNLTLVEPKAAAGYTDYVKHQLHLIAAGMGVTYEMMTGDVREVNFSSARVSMLEFRRNAEQMQWLTLIPSLMQPIWDAFIDAAMLAGKIRPGDTAVDWATPKWDYVNPEQDVKADLAEISGGLTTISEKLRKRGYKPELVFAELKSDFDRLSKDGTLAIMLQLQTNQAPQTAPPPSSSSSSTPPAGAARAQDGTDIDAMRAESRVQNTLLTTLLATRAEPQVINIINEIKPTPVEVRSTVNVPEPHITIQAHMPQTRAEPQVINITNKVQPAPVTVNNAFARHAETTIIRDAKTEITKTTTHYTP